MLKQGIDDRFINITGRDISCTKPETVFTAVFHCTNCRHKNTCKRVKKCKFVDYIRKQIPNTSYAYNVKNPVLVVSITNMQDFNNTFNIIQNAKRLRVYRTK